MLLLDRIKNYVKDDFSRFHMPGHKGKLICDPVFDVTELDCTDDLYDSCGFIRRSEELISKIYGSALAVFSTQGNTLCVQSMLRLAVPNGGKIIVARNCHKSVVNSIGLLGLDVIWVDIYGNGNVDSNNIKAKIDKNPDVKAVFITSPDYFGSMADMEKIKSICGDIPLLVDNAHGSHLVFFDKHPISLGADLCADSAHKTLPVLTGGAWLHLSKNFVNKRKIEYENIKESMQIFGSTSPSFLTLISLEKCAIWMDSVGKKEFNRLCDLVENIKSINNNIIYNSKMADPVRIVFDTSGIGLRSSEFMKHLENFKIKPEFGTDVRTVLIPTPFNCAKDWERLKSSLHKLYMKSKICYKHDKILSGVTILSVRDAMFRESEFVPLEGSLNRVASETLCKCPPGVPILVPGELITLNKLKLIQQINKKYVKVVK